jgi:hypothetical protein
MLKRIALVAALAAGLCAPSHAGWEYTAVTRGEGGPNSEMLGSAVKAWISGSQARVDFTESGNPMMAAGTYAVTKDAGKTLYLVNPAEKAYSTWDLEGMAGMAGGAMKMMNMKISGAKVETLLEEDGGKILGYPTKHYRFRTSYATEMNFMGMKQSTKTLQEEDVWATAALNDAALGFWMKKKDFQTGDEELDKMMKGTLDKVQGFPLKRVVATTTEDSAGTRQVVKMTAEVTALKESKPDAKLFEIPAGYQETPLFPAAAMGAGPGKTGGSKGTMPDPAMLKKMLEGVNRR